MILSETTVQDTPDATGSVARAYSFPATDAGDPAARMLPGDRRTRIRENITMPRKDVGPRLDRAATVGRPLRAVALCIACWNCLAADLPADGPPGTRPAGPRKADSSRRRAVDANAADMSPFDARSAVQRMEELTARGQFDRAIESGRTAARLAERTLGPEDPRTIAVKQSLAAVYLEVEDKAAAAPLLRESIAVLERQRPTDPLALSQAVGDLAQTVEDAREAEPLYRRALALAEEFSGPHHVGTAHALNNLAVFLHLQRRNEEAEPLMRRALRIRERTRGLADPLTAQSLCTLGSIAMGLGETSVAESLMRRSLELRRSSLPDGHPDIAESCALLAQAVLVSGPQRADEAARLAGEAFDIDRTTFGPDRFRALKSMHVKADAIAAQGRKDESNRMHEELIAKLERLSPPQTDAVADAVADYGWHMLLSGKFAQAATLTRRALLIRQKAHGPDDEKAIDMRRQLAEALYGEVRAHEAVAEGRAILASLEKKGGDPDRAHGTAMASLAKYLLATNGMDEARSLLRKSITILEKTVGRGSQEVLRPIYLLALTHVVMDELDQAERLLDDGLRRFAAERDIRTGDAAVDLIRLRGVICRKTGRIKEAEAAEAAVKAAGDPTP